VNRRVACISAFALAAIAITAGTAWAASTRAEYVAQVDPICQSALTADKALFRRYVKTVKRVRKRHPNLDSATHPPKVIRRQVVKYYEAFARSERSATSQIALISAAPGDESTVALWIDERTRLADLTKSGARALVRDQERLFVKRIVKSINSELHALSLAKSLGMTACAAPPSGFFGP